MNEIREYIMCYTCGAKYGSTEMKFTNIELESTLVGDTPNKENSKVKLVGFRIGVIRMNIGERNKITTRNCKST